MKKLIAAVLCLLPLVALAQTRERTGVLHDARIVRIIDGDTIAVAAPYLPDPLRKELSLRIFGVDTPERGALAKCEIEAQKSRQASAFVREKINSATKRQMLLMGWDKYGGRVLGDLVLDDVSLRQMLIQEGLAREYFGGFKASWCR